MVIAAFVVACLGVIVTLCLGLYVHCKSREIMDKVTDAVLYTFPGAQERKRLLDDIHRTGQIRGTISERELGVYSIEWKVPGQDKW